MSWPFNPNNPYGAQQPYIVFPQQMQPVQYGQMAPERVKRVAKRLKPKKMAEMAKEYREAADELEKLFKKEDKKKDEKKLDWQKVFMLLVLMWPVAGPLWLLWMQSVLK